MKNRQLSLIIFLLVELYILVMCISFANLVNYKLLSLIGTTLCFIIGIFLFCKTHDYIIMISSIFLFLMNDIVGILFEKLNMVSICLMIIIQILYFLRTYISSDKDKNNIFIRIGTVPVSIFLCFLFLKGKMDIISILWCIYILNLFLNILYSISEIGINNLFPIGLLFLLVHAMFSTLISLENYTIVNIAFVNYLLELPFDIKLLFYFPAQVILTCSIFTVNRRCFSKINKENENGHY